MSMQTQHNDVTIKDGDREVKVRIFKMSSIEAFNWALQLAAVLARAGIPVPRNIATNISELGGMVAKAFEDGYIFRMPGMNAKELEAVIYQLPKHAHVILQNEQTGEPQLLALSNIAVLQGQFTTLSGLLWLFGEIAGFSFGFFEPGGSLQSVIEKLPSNLLNSKTSHLSQGQSSQEQESTLSTDSEPSTVSKTRLTSSKVTKSPMKTPDA